MNLFYLVMALCAGSMLSVQAAVNSRLGAGLGGQPLVAAFVSFAVGTVFLGVVALLKADWQPVASGLGQQGWWRFTGGVLGACFLFTSVFLAPRLGVTNAMFLFIIGQLCAGMLIDGLGLIQMPVRPLHWWKFAGLAIMLGGLVLFTFGDRFFRSWN
ncbi:DMT family transporter [Pseudooceanicola sp. CBS1P-1]|uniref:EamA-like transporter family protein n=1 Tax=Pseudooceanicola albus TaxID=2692189 RepID=A0A6L7GA39_9RHOB|nr:MULTISPECIES: DMT family transporter [Pseudooceanicola]MBT9382896.1 DMT family transporter [Pseudooceanicola endophyticus]MXN20180.1 EamA-like transporter family protein [Pseudooceanicola albus]